MSILPPPASPPTRPTRTRRQRFWSSSPAKRRRRSSRMPITNIPSCPVCRSASKSPRWGCSSPTTKRRPRRSRPMPPMHRPSSTRLAGTDRARPSHWEKNAGFGDEPGIFNSGAARSDAPGRTFAIHGLARHAQPPRRLGAVAATGVEHGHYVSLFDQLQRLDGLCPGDTSRSREFLGKLTEDHRAFDQVAQFAHISGPVVAAELEQNLLVQFLRRHAKRAGKFTHEQGGQFNDILGALLEAGHLDIDDIDPVVEIGAKTPCPHRLLQIGIGGEEKA